MSSYDNVDGPSSDNTIYHDKSPALVIFSKAYGIVTVVMVVLAIVIAILEIHQDWAFSLLIVNLVISSVVTFFVVLWYKRGDLDAGKMWFVFVTMGILIFQCLTTIIYVTVHKDIISGVTPVPAFTVKPTATTVKPPPGDLFMAGESVGLLTVPHG